ncbi:hypothetical protein H4218_005463 [Coemansia sp. IMI 209128]|nr:hypothetical protein H4218_005463 [Coemansia sp. IMI 209128]
MDSGGPDQAGLNKGDGDSASAVAQVAESALHQHARHSIAAPDKTYAAAVASSSQAADVHDSEANDRQREGTEGYSDEYTEDSVFSDSIYDENDDESSGDDAGLGGALPGTLSYDSRLSSGATSPNLAAARNPTRAAEALGAAHRFVSHTPWGTATGRLTRDQRHRGRLWDDPNAEPAETKDEYAAGERFPTSVDNDRASAGDGVAGARMGSDHAGESSREQIVRLTHQLHYQQQRLQQMQAQMRQQQARAAEQVVNVVSVAQGTKGYGELRQQMQREQRLHQDAIEGKLAEGPRIVTIAQFAKSVARLLRIGFPSAGCTEARLAAALVAVLGVRTALDVWFSNFNARSVRAVVTHDRATLLRRLLPEYLGMMLPMAAVNQAIKWAISSLTIALRVRLGRYAHERYVDGITNITWSQIHRQGPSGSMPAYERPDWLLTVQIHRFADMFPRLLADVVKPTMDWFVFSRLLSRYIGRRGSLAMVGYVVLASAVIRLSSPPTGTHAGRVAQLEEKYRGVYARVSAIIQRAAAAATPLLFGRGAVDEEIARLPNAPSPRLAPQGAFVPRVQAAFRQRARESLDASLDAVAAGVVGTNVRRFFGGIGETILAKYGATLMAYYLLSRPLCLPGRPGVDAAAVMMSYSRNSAYLINLAQATTRLLLMLNDLPKFVWSTVRVDRLLRSLDVHARYRSAVDGSSSPGD